MPSSGARAHHRGASLDALPDSDSDSSSSVASLLSAPNATLLRATGSGPIPNARRLSIGTSTRILGLIDGHVLPLMLAVYFLQSLDKATISYASLLGLIEDAHLEGDQFSWLGSVVYVAQLLAQMPIALALVKLPVGKFTSVLVFCWGVTLSLMAGARGFGSLLVLRFLLGGFEAGVAPAFVAMTGVWWKRGEQTVRTSLWYAMNGVTMVVGSLVVYGLGGISVGGLRSYQLIFLVFGAATMGFSYIMWKHMPDSPASAGFLTAEDRELVVARLRGGQGMGSRLWRHSHLVEALQDPKTWLWAAMTFCISIPSGGVYTFGPLIISTFVTDPFRALLFNCPMGVVNGVAIFGGSLLAARIRMKGPVIALLCLVPALSCIVFLAYPHTEEYRHVLFPALLCMYAFAGVTPLIYSWSAQNTAGNTKQKTVSAVVVIASSAGNIVGPLLYTPAEAPAYSRGLRWNLLMYLCVMALVGAATVCLASQNREHARRRVAMGKRAVVVDTSLLSAREEERRAGRAQRGRKKTDDYETGDGDDGSSLVEMAARTDHELGDVTDMGNEDFVYVF